MRDMTRLCISFCILLIIYSACFAGTNKVLIIGIDGCRPDSLLAAKTPNIDKLWSDGAFSFHAKTDTKTVSGPCWTSILTGTWHTKHGIVDNGYSIPTKYPHFFQLLKQAKPELKTASFVHWAPIHKILSSTSAEIIKEAKPSSAVAELVAESLSTNDSDAIFVQFDDVDHAGHKHGYGPHVSKYLDSIEASDEMVGKIISALESRVTYEKENWLIIVISDHGGIGNGHGGSTPQESTVFFITHGKSVKKGELKTQVAVVDTAVTAMSHLDINIDPKWNLDGKIQAINNSLKRK